MKSMTNCILALTTMALAFAFIEEPLVAQPAGYFTQPKRVPGLPASGFMLVDLTVTLDGLTMVFFTDRVLYQATRSSRDDAFTGIHSLGSAINGSSDGYAPVPGPALTADGLVLVFARSPSSGSYWEQSKLFEARRASITESFGQATPLPDAINQYTSFTPHLSPDGLLLLFASRRPGGQGDEDIWVATRPSQSDVFGAPVNLNDFFPGSQVNSTHEEIAPWLSTDRRVLFFADLDLRNNSERPGSLGGPDIWVATRPDTDSPFGQPQNLNDLGLGSTVNSVRWEGWPCLSRDWPAPGSKLYFGYWSGTGQPNTAIWEADWVPFQWFQAAIPSASSPPARAFHGMVYDTVRGVTLLHGGGTEPGATVQTDTWAWDGRTWTLLTQQGPGEFAAGFAMDSDRGVAVLHGGFGNGSPRPALGDTWEWDGQTWKRVSSNSGPGMRAGSTMAYDPQRKRIVLHGGSRDLDGSAILSDTWAWDGTAWQEIPNANGPPRVQHQMVYDAKRQVMVVFGGFAPKGSSPVDTWEFDGAQWRQVAASGPPGGRQFPVLFYDSMRETVILSGGGQYEPYGGFGYKYFDDLWQWDGRAWSEITPAGAHPSAVQGGAGAYDSRRGRLVRFGGTPDYERRTFWRETWEYGLPELRVGRIGRQTDGKFVIEWSGGAPPYQLQRRPKLNEGGWLNVGGPTDQTSVTAQSEGNATYFRVMRAVSP